MVYTKVIFFFTLLQTCLVYVYGKDISISNESYFRIEPRRPLFGDTVYVSCRMLAPEGYTFYHSEPAVAFDEDSELQNFPSEIGKKFIEGVDTERFKAYTNSDEACTNVSLIVEIKNFSEADVGLKISCINRLHIRKDFRDEKIIRSGVLQNAARPPPPTNVLVGMTPHSPLTCQSQLIVTWDNVPDDNTDVPVEHYNVSVKVGGVVQFAEVCSGNSPILVKLKFGSHNSKIQAEVNSINKAGISSPAVSNVKEIYRPEIVNLTVHVHKELSLIYLSWKFKTSNTDWLVDVSYSLVVAFRRFVNGSERIFKTYFSIPSDITYYILRTSLVNDEIESVTLNKIKICNQVLKDQNNSLTYLQNVTQETTKDTQNVTQVTSLNVTQNVTQVTSLNVTQNVTQVTSLNVPPVITTTVSTYTDKLPNRNVTAGAGSDILSSLKRLNFEFSYVVILSLIGFIFILMVGFVVIPLVVVIVLLCFKYNICIRARPERAAEAEIRGEIPV